MFRTVALCSIACAASARVLAAQSVPATSSAPAEESAAPRPELDVSGSAKFEGGRGDTDRVSIYRSAMRVAFSLSPAWRLGVGREFVLYDNVDRDRLDSVDRYEAAFEPNAEEKYRARFETHTEGEHEQAFTGAASAEVALGAAVKLRAGASRTVVEESLLSAVGENVAGGRAGEVRANEAMLGADVRLGRRWDAFVRGGAGVDEGVRVKQNAKWGGELGFGFEATPERPWLRVGYRAQAAGFRHDASGFFRIRNAPGVEPGGYFSPQLRVAHEIGADCRAPLGDAWSVELRGAVGIEQIDSATRNFSSIGSTSRASAKIDWMPVDSVTLGLAYSFEDGGPEVRASTVGVKLEWSF